jgi:hypothetical protein
MIQIGSDPNAEISVDLVRHMAYKTLLFYRRKFFHEYGELVICCDAKNTWRKARFTHYKGKRKSAREKSGFDWEEIFKCFDIIKSELRDNMPYKLVEVDGAEADDIIGVLATRFGTVEPIVIVSSDEDFIQLQKYPLVSQFSPGKKRFLKPDCPIIALKRKIFEGDKGDGVPNFLSDDDAIMNPDKRQKNIYQVKLDEWIKMPLDAVCDTEVKKKNYERNQWLIDLSFTPEALKDKIIQTYDNHKPVGRSKIYNFLLSNGLRQLSGSVGDF